MHDRHAAREAVLLLFTLRELADDRRHRRESGKPPISAKITPHRSHAQMTPCVAPGGSKPYSKKFQPSERKRADQARLTRLGIFQRAAAGA